MWIKICGNTRLQDCLLAAQLGADAVGFIFAEGKRTVTAAQVAPIVAALPVGLEKIGVFTSTDAKAIVEQAQVAGLTGVQLHGTYDPALVRGVRAAVPSGRVLRLLQVVHWELHSPVEDQIATFAAEIELISAYGLVDALLVDSQTAQRSGGTGRTFDWAAVAPILQKAALPVIVAGGLNPENVAAAVAALKPWGLDVSSGVEDAPGVKNTDALRRFVQQARGQA